MNEILSSSVSGAMNSMLDFINQILLSIYDVVFNVQDVMQNNSLLQTVISNLTECIYLVGSSLIVIRFLKKAFDIYVLWSDGDPEIDPASLLTRFVKAVAVALSFPYVYRLFVNLAKEVLSQTLSVITTESVSVDFIANIQSMGLIGLVLGLVFFVLIIMLYFKLMGRGIELLLMQCGVPLACCGILDDDSGMFKPFCLQFSKAIITTIAQIILIKLGFAIGFTSGGDIWSLVWGVAFMFTANATPKLMSEFMVPTSGGGGLSQKIYSSSMMINQVKRVFTR